MNAEQQGKNAGSQERRAGGGMLWMAPLSCLEAKHRLQCRTLGSELTLRASRAAKHQELLDHEIFPPSEESNPGNSSRR